MTIYNTITYPIQAIISGICFYQRIKINSKTPLQVQLSSNYIEYDSYYYHMVKFTSPKTGADIQFKVRGNKCYDNVSILSLNGKRIDMNQCGVNFEPQERLKKGRTYFLVFRLPQITSGVLSIVASSEKDSNNRLHENRVLTLKGMMSKPVEKELNIASFQA